MNDRRRRLLLVIEPQLLRDSLERLLDAAGVDDVVALPPGASAEGTFDGAIVSGSEGVEVDAPLVIDLTDPEHGRGVLHTEAGDEIIDLRDLDHVLDLLDEHVSGPTSRRDALRDLGL